MTADRIMTAADLGAGTMPGPDGFVRRDVTLDEWAALAAGLASGSSDLLGLWVDADRVRLALMNRTEPARAIASLQLAGANYPSIGQHHPPALRLERAMRDLYGVTPEGLPDERAWLDHGRWPTPPRTRIAAGHAAPSALPYAFLAAEGQPLHQIPVGPVHAGIIEPGHFRFSANGECVVRLEERLGYVHKGVEALLVGADIEKAARIVARVSGDSTVALSYAFALAVEAALGISPPARAGMLRAVMAELERLAHHINDVGAICNDASVVALQARCTILREDILQTAARCFGHRLMMDRIAPGGLVRDIDGAGATLIRDLLDRVSKGFEPVVAVYDSMPSLQDRTVTTGIVKPELAARFGAGGFVGRASGRAFDARKSFPYGAYAGLAFAMPTRTAGDVDARVWVRIEEVRQSLSIVGALIDRLTPGPIRAPMPAPAAGEGAALVEAFRGDLLVTVRLDGEGRVAHAHVRDASWFQWPLLEAAIEGNIVADFPLCNKSFNCSYSGHDI